MDAHVVRVDRLFRQNCLNLYQRVVGTYHRRQCRNYPARCRRRILFPALIPYEKTNFVNLTRTRHFNSPRHRQPPVSPPTPSYTMFYRWFRFENYIRARWHLDAVLLPSSGPGTHTHENIITHRCRIERAAVLYNIMMCRWVTCTNTRSTRDHQQFTSMY